MKKIITLIMSIITLSGYSQELFIGDSNALHVFNDAVFYVNGTATGDANYHRTLDTTNWYLISSPLSGQIFNDAYVSANNIASGQGNNRGIATHQPATNTWAYYQASSVDQTFTTGFGYSFKKAAAGNVSFKGIINTADVTPTVTADSWMLLGNPFLSYMNIVSLINDNTSNLKYIGVYVWNEVTKTYDIKNLAEPIVLAPAQGFFVRVNPGVTSFTLKKSYQQATGDVFRKNANTMVELLMTDGSNNKSAKVYYLDNNATVGHDSGYDGEIFGGIVNANDFAVYTQLVSNDEGKKYQIQALPKTDMENKVVPVGVTAAAGKEITFTAASMNFPEGLKMFLEDKVTNTVTRLDEENTSYKVTMKEAINGIGRFYLHTKSKGVLSTDNVSFSNISIYAKDNNILRVVGLSNGKANVKMFNMLGKQVFATSFNATGVDDIKLAKVAAGIYTVHLEKEGNILNKKLLIE